jgi:hypothetical protein
MHIHAEGKVIMLMNEMSFPMNKIKIFRVTLDLNI